MPCERRSACNISTYVPTLCEIQVVIPREGPNAGKAYVKFSDAGTAAKAFQNLNGRSFAGNTVKVSYLKDEEIPAN